MNDGPDPAALATFAQECNQFYLDGTRSSTPPRLSTDDPHYQIFIKVQNAVRELSHQQRTFVGNTTLEAVLQAPVWPRTKSQRRRELSNFISSWGRHVGVQPFLRGLWAILYSQKRYGAYGERRMTWEVDDAVFLESAPDFVEDAVSVLKGTLGFETLTTMEPMSRPDLSQITVPIHTRTITIPLQCGLEYLPEPDGEDTTPLISAPDHLPNARVRQWVFPPSIANDEVEALANLFPRAVKSKPNLKDPELGTVMTCGTGRMWSSELMRDHNWRGTRWFQVKQWIKWLFGIM